MEAIWLLDRAAALVAYTALYLALLTGVLYNTEGFGFLHQASRRIHVEISVFAVLVTLLHGALGVVDSYLVLSDEVPEPAYSDVYFAAGVGVGAGAMVMLLVAVAGFLDPERFEDSWLPQTIHGFVYPGFVFATVHAAAVGTDVSGPVRPLFGATTAFLVYVLVLRLLVLRRPSLAQ